MTICPSVGRQAWGAETWWSSLNGRSNEILEKLLFISISASGSGANTKNDQCIHLVNSAVAGSPSLNLNKIENFSKASHPGLPIRTVLSGFFIS